MRKRTPRRNAVAGGALMLVTFSIGLMLAVLVAGSASAKTSPKKPTTATTANSPAAPLMTTTAVSPADDFSAINGTVNAASDHEIVGSSAFPNFTTGAVDNYYTMAHAHVDNSPFAEGTSSPFDTGPVGQTAAAGNFQQPQYADSRWPGGPDNATYGSKGGPYATSAADNNRATANAEEPSNTMSGPGLHGTKTLALPVGLDGRLRQALAGWKTVWSGRLRLKNAVPKVTTPAAPPSAPVPVPSAPVEPPSVTTPSLPAVGGVTPPATVPKLPSAGAMGATRSPASVSLPKPPAPLPTAPRPGGASAPTSGGTETALTSSTLATLVYKTKSKTDTAETNTCKTETVGATGTTTTTTTTTATTTTDKPKSRKCELVLSGESSMGRVTLGGGQIVIEGIHVTASITNDGTNPSYEAAISVASATIGGIPVTIDENGVHVAGQGGGLPYQQASAALNSALNKAGIEIFLVAPEVTNCSQSGQGSGSGTSTTSTTTTTSTTSTDQSGGASPCGGQGAMGSASCDQSGSSSGSGGGPGGPAPAPTSTQSSTTTTSSSCGPPNDMGASCDQTGTGTTGGTTTTAGPALGPGYQSSTTTPPGSCGPSGMTSSSCTKAGTANGTTTGSSYQSSTTTSTDTTSPDSGGMFQFGPGPGTSVGEETVTATGVHIVFTQPVSPPGVPAQYVEHILGEVFVDSLAAPAAPLPNVPFSSSSFSSSPSPSAFSSCLGRGRHSGLKTSGSGSTASGGGSSLAGSGSSGSGSLAASASSLGSSSQPGSGSTGSSMPASFARALHKPLWLLLAYVVWQLLVIGTGWSLWNWRRGGAT